ncbi:MAG: HD domain-containing protein [Lachnospiraceae bacterium]|nr:HD domain-containing protein [Lachnospiraceae bacterium]
MNRAYQREDREKLRTKSRQGAVARRLLAGVMILSVLLLLRQNTYAEETAKERILGKGADFASILYDSSNGLPTSEANAIAQTGDGFIWLGGYSGLVRYDGTSFDHFDASSGISSVFSLYVDDSDRLWIGTNENGVALYDHGNIKVFGRAKEERSYSIRAICQDENGNIIVGTTQGLCYVGKDLELHAINDPQIDQEYITALIRDEEGRIVGLTMDGAVFKMQDLHINTYYDPGNFGADPVNTIYARTDKKGEFWVGTTESEIMSVQLSKQVIIKETRSAGDLKNIKGLHQVGNYLWIIATNGIGYYDEQKECRVFDDLPLDSSIGQIMEDHEGNLWFTSTRQGVLKLVPDRFTDVSKHAGLEHMVVNSTALAKDILYLATDKGLIALEGDEREPCENALTKAMSGVRIRCIYKDAAGNLWLCTHGDTGLVEYTTDSQVIIYNKECGLDAEKVRDVIQLSDGRMAAATGDGLYILENGEVTEHYSHSSGISNTEILCVTQAQDGRILMGSDGDGIYVLDKKKISRISFDDGLTSGVVMRIKYDPERKLYWIITSNSIEYMKGNQITQVQQFPYSNNLDIFFDENGGAWVLSSNGIYVTKADELVNNEKIEYIFYNSKSGLPYVTTSNSRSYLSEDGELYISGTTGVCMVNINSDNGNNENVKLAVPSVVIDDEEMPVTEGKTVSIPAGCKKLLINCYAITYGLSNPRVRFYLEGFEKTPVNMTKQDLVPVAYTNLDGGDYTFHLEVIDDKTGKTAKSLEIPIHKETSPYESIWFWIILLFSGVGIIGLVIWGYFRKRTRILEEEHEEDQRFIDQIMHTFAKCVDMRDSQNRGHSFRVAHYTKLLAKKLSFTRGYTDDQIHEFYNIALLHDIGKLSIPDAILNKPARLNDEEYVIMKTHAAKGEEILKGVGIVPDLAVGAGCHHERIDGRGYPHGLKDDEIPEVARIIAVADTFDAMYSTRPYRKQMLLEDVLAEIQKIKGSQLDPEVVDALMALSEDGELDRAKVDKAVEEIPALLMMPTGDEYLKEKEELAKKNEAFQDSLGLNKKE